MVLEKQAKGIFFSLLGGSVALQQLHSMVEQLVGVHGLSRVLSSRGAGRCVFRVLPSNHLQLQPVRVVYEIDDAQLA
jgi:hypothetical protein